MVRKFKNRPSKDIESILEESIERIDFRNITKDKIALLLRLLISGVANYFFVSPDNIVNVGYMQFTKSADKDELFKVKIIRNEGEGVLNASTLWRYYKGELSTEAKLKGIIDEFVDGLLEYSQNQEVKITKLTGRLHK